MEKGEIKSKQEAVLEALSVRFGEVPEDLARNIQQISDLPRLSQLLRQAITCASIFEFQAEL